MPRPKLPKSQRLTEVTFVKFRKEERRRLDRRSKLDKKSRSKILREGFLLYEKRTLAQKLNEIR